MTLTNFWPVLRHAMVYGFRPRTNKRSQLEFSGLFAVCMSPGDTFSHDSYTRAAVWFNDPLKSRYYKPTIEEVRFEWRDEELGVK
jgi:hypothetical protein